MGGADGLGGYVYQQDYAAFRLLVSEATRLLANDSSKCVQSFKIEGRHAGDGPAWDVAWKLQDAAVHLRECKNTSITRADCAVFYSRVRDEINTGINPDAVNIGWVTDRRKQTTKIIEHLDGMRKLAKTRALDEVGRAVHGKLNPRKLHWPTPYTIFHIMEIKKAQFPKKLSTAVVRDPT